MSEQVSSGMSPFALKITLHIRVINICFVISSLICIQFELNYGED